jgi:hypothetical protein
MLAAFSVAAGPEKQGNGGKEAPSSGIMGYPCGKRVRWGFQKTPKQARREADPIDLPPERINTHFCVIVARLTGSLIRKEDLSTGDYFAGSGNFIAAPNETLANHRRPT